MAQDPADLFQTIKATMPLSDPGSLSDADYKTITDYIVGQNKPK